MYTKKRGIVFSKRLDTSMKKLRFRDTIEKKYEISESIRIQTTMVLIITFFFVGFKHA
jgi:hypothetical protein